MKDAGGAPGGQATTSCSEAPLTLTLLACQCPFPLAVDLLVASSCSFLIPSTQAGAFSRAATGSFLYKSKKPWMTAIETLISPFEMKAAN